MGTEQAFTEHEYLLLMASLKPRRVLGIGQSLIGHRKAQVMMATALRSLQKKGHIARGRTGISLGPHVQPLITVCASPQHTLISTFTNARKEQDIRFYHISAETVVEDRVLPSRDRQLSDVGDSDHMVQQLVEQFGLSDQPAAPDGPLVVSSHALALLQRSVAAGTKGVLSELRQAGVDAAVAEPLAHAVSTAVSNSALSRAGSTASSRRSAFGLLESANGLREIRLLAGGQVRFAPVDADTAIQLIAEFVSQLQTEAA